MSDVLVRGLSSQTVKSLKARARRNGRSLQSEAKLILQDAAGAAEISSLLSKWKTRFAGRKFSDSAAMIREDRER